MAQNIGIRFRALLRSPDPFLIRFALILISAGLLFFCLGWGGVKIWRESRRMVLTHHARHAVESGHWTEALGFLRRVLENHPNDLEANRLMAAYCKKKSPRTYLEWLTRLQGLEPDNTRTSLELAEIHLRLQHFDAAENLARGLVNYPKLAASARNILALTAAHRGSFTEALGHFRDAHRAQPESLPILANYAAFLTRANDPALDAEREDLLGRLAKMEGGDLAVMRLRLARDASRNDTASVLSLSARIAAHPRHQFQDELQRLDILLAFRPGDYPAALARVKEDCLQDRPRMPVLLEWFMERRMWHEALSWIEAFPSNLQASVYFRFIRLQCSLQAPVTPERILAWLEAEPWRECGHLRLAGLAEAHHRAGHDDKAAACRREAMAMALQDPLSTYELLDLIEGWSGWEAEAETLLTRLSGDKTYQTEALQKLFQIQLAKKDAAKLLAVAEQMFRLNRASTILEGNYLSLALLNNPHSSRIHRACEQYYHLHPDHPHALSLQAYALVLQGKMDEGLALMEKIPAELRQRAPINLYYGYALYQSGRTQAAQSLLKNLDPQSLLDLEQKILSVMQKQ